MDLGGAGSLTQGLVTPRQVLYTEQQLLLMCMSYIV